WHGRPNGATLADVQRDDRRSALLLSSLAPRLAKEEADHARKSTWRPPAGAGPARRRMPRGPARAERRGPGRGRPRRPPARRPGPRERAPARLFPGARPGPGPRTEARIPP